MSYKTLAEHLAELEATDPDVAEAARKLDEAWWRLRQPPGSYFRRPKRRFTGGR